MPQEPIWWNEARELRAQGYTFEAIGEAVGKRHTAVIYALDPDYRERHKAKKRVLSREYWRKHGKPPEDSGRKSVVGAARLESAETGEHIDLILRRWGEPARREWRGAA